MRQAENKNALDLFPVSHSDIKTSSDIQLLSLFLLSSVFQANSCEREDGKIVILMN